MKDFFFKHPLGKFLFDVVAGGVIGAGLAAVNLTDAAGVSDASATIGAAAVAGIRSAASTGLVAALKTLRETSTP